jgi:hypothetical protein
LPDLEHAKAAVLNNLTSVDAQRGYRHAIDEFVDSFPARSNFALRGAPPEFLDSLKQAHAADERTGIAKFVLWHASVHPNAVRPMQLALLYGQTGDMDAAFHHLERSIEGHDPALVPLAVGPQWDELRSDPRFEKCLMRMGLGGLRSLQEPVLEHPGDAATLFINRHLCVRLSKEGFSSKYWASTVAYRTRRSLRAQIRSNRYRERACNE